MEIDFGSSASVAVSIGSTKPEASTQQAPDGQQGKDDWGDHDQSEQLRATSHCRSEERLPIMIGETG